MGHAKIGTETEANERSYKTASGELILDRGGLCVQGTTVYEYEVTFPGGNADVHKTLINVSKAYSEGHVAAVDSNGGHTVPHNGTLARNLNQSFKVRSLINLVQCVCILRIVSTWIHNN